MRKIIAVYIVGVLLACLSSCASFDVELWKSKSTLNTDKKIAIEQMERIMNALQDRDAEMLKSMFAKNALAEISDIQAMIAELYDYVPCCSENMEYRGSIVGGLFEDGQRMKDHCISFDVKTSDGVYRFAFKYISEDTENPDNVGLWSLYVIDQDDDTDPEFAYRADSQYIPGIHIGIKNVLPEGA